ncbi:DUF3144 domain-containing protein [Alphaproteobacteria bacterium]|nr:DUF3144 domain-containing protein [Alphaproteobacteria bacterium]
MELPKWHERPESSDKKIKDQTILDGKNFLKLADHFITFANTKNKTIKSTDLKYIMLYATARYSAHVGKNVIEIENHEEYVKHLSAQFVDMLREHLADPNL